MSRANHTPVWLLFADDMRPFVVLRCHRVQTAVSGTMYRIGDLLQQDFARKRPCDSCPAGFEHSRYTGGLEERPWVYRFWI